MHSAVRYYKNNFTDGQRQVGCNLFRVQICFSNYIASCKATNPQVCVFAYAIPKIFHTGLKDAIDLLLGNYNVSPALGITAVSPFASTTRRHVLVVGLYLIFIFISPSFFFIPSTANLCLCRFLSFCCFPWPCLSIACSSQLWSPAHKCSMFFFGLLLPSSYSRCCIRCARGG